MTDVFDEMLAATPDTATVEAPESNAENTSEWPKRVSLPAGEKPEGSVTIPEFADHVNRDLIRAEAARLIADDVDPLDAAVQAGSAAINPASFYQAIRAQRNPMPHYVVESETEVEEKDAEGNVTGTKIEKSEKTFVPLDVALEWWKNKPIRGAGGGASRTEDDIEKRLVRAGKKFADLDSAKKRLVKLQDNIKRMTEQVDKYDGYLKADGKTWDEAKAAYEASVEADEEETVIEG